MTFICGAICLSVASSGCGQSDRQDAEKGANDSSKSNSESADDSADDAADDGADDAADDSADDAPAQPGLDDPSARAWALGKSWYPQDPIELDARVQELLDATDVTTKQRGVGIAVPHASLRFSGPTSAAAYASMLPPSVVILLTPDHSREGEPVAIWNEGPWLIPGHALQLDHDATARVIELLPDFVPDRVAFNDHEAEMQLPFIQAIAPDARLVVLAFQDNRGIYYPKFDLARIDQFGSAIAKLYRELEDQGEDVLMVSSVDMTHHEPLAAVEAKDPVLARHIGELDVEGLYEYVTEEKISICGEIPTSILMSALRKLGYTKFNQRKLDNSFAVAQDEEDVVGYLSVATWEADPRVAPDVEDGGVTNSNMQLDAGDAGR